MADIVRRAAGAIKMGKARPLWLDTVARLHPPLNFAPPEYVQKTKAGRVPKPPKIEYPEDRYRRKYFAQHRSEVLRPTSLDERLGSVSLDGFAAPDLVIERQTSLIEQGVPPEKAYTMAIAHYQTIRQQQEVERRVAQEQALAAEALPASAVIEELAMSERVALERASGDSA